MWNFSKNFNIEEKCTRWGSSARIAAPETRGERLRTGMGVGGGQMPLDAPKKRALLMEIWWITASFLDLLLVPRRNLEYNFQ